MNSSPAFSTHDTQFHIEFCPFCANGVTLNETGPTVFSRETDSLQTKQKEVGFWRVRAGIWVTASVLTFYLSLRRITRTINEPKTSISLRG